MTIRPISSSSPAYQEEDDKNTTTSTESSSAAVASFNDESNDISNIDGGHLDDIPGTRAKQQGRQLAIVYT
eukprot:CAMPEP_0168794016 /NCGR_PEP_ID=MMETSP0725-20121227/15401_1 /TAXON_ID=265536 /ORGANISM="Amphiprora sp., Strain CCMP467" /LENGTH=70 /DNA_ID=CAMNT_0008844845 /DNA_START=56 /DNA_END=265 /DNA_ORIENTATION=+